MMNWKRIRDWFRAKAPKDGAQPSVAESARTPAPDERLQVVIGLDFGTAFTKVVIGVRGRKYGVPLNSDERGADKYLLPTPLNLKMRILDGGLDQNVRERIVKHLAEVLQKSREWLLSEKDAVLGSAIPEWAVNIGMPTENHKDKNLLDMYRDFVSEAWNISSSQSARSNDVEPELHLDNIAAFPEFVAQIQGYISGPQRNLGIHTLMDVGAGTVDTTVFIVHREKGENKHPILAASVKPLGTIRLGEHHCSAVGQPGACPPHPHKQFPSRERFADLLGVTPEKMKEADYKFQGRVLNEQIRPLLKRAKEDCPDQSEWREGMPLMLCGGGKRVDFYRAVAGTLVSPEYGDPMWEVFIDVPENLDAPSLLQKDMDRLSVAHGLSFDRFDIGDVSWPTPIPPRGSSGKCPRCNGSGGLHSTCDMCGGRVWI